MMIFQNGELRDITPALGPMIPVCCDNTYVAINYEKQNVGHYVLSTVPPCKDKTREVTAYFTSKQLLPFGFYRHDICVKLPNLQ